MGYDESKPEGYYTRRHKHLSHIKAEEGMFISVKMTYYNDGKWPRFYTTPKYYRRKTEGKFASKGRA